MQLRTPGVYVHFYPGLRLSERLLNWVAEHLLAVPVGCLLRELDGPSTLS